MADFNHVIVNLTTQPPVHIKLSNDTDLHTTVKVSGGATNMPVYTGDYEVTPTLSDIILPTKNKAMTSDVKVEAVAYAETTNPQGGITITIL